MTFEGFVDILKNSIKDYLPESYQDAKVVVQEQKKLNDRYLGLSLAQEDKPISAIVNLDTLFNRYRETSPFCAEKALQQAASILQQEQGTAIMACLEKCMGDYGELKKHLYIRVSSAEKNARMLETVPHILQEDLAITFHLLLEDRDDTDDRMSVIVTNQMLGAFDDITEDQLYQDAIGNSTVLCPTYIQGMEELIAELIGQESEEDHKPGSGAIVITNKKKIDGAAVIFYPGILDHVGEKLGGDFFILPSSVHDVIAIKDGETVTWQELKEMVMEVNRTQVAPKDQLTDNVYHYDTKEKMFETAEKHAKRVAEEAARKKELAAESYLYLKMRPGEAKEEAEKRLTKLLEDAGIEYQFFKTEERDI